MSVKATLTNRGSDLAVTCDAVTERVPLPELYRDCPVVHIGAAVMLKGLEVPHPLFIETEHREVRVGPAGEGDEPNRLSTSDYEAFRWRLGRRSRHQLATMHWSGDPEPYLDRLCIFGPAQRDLIE